MCPSHKEEYSVSVFEDRVLKRILGCKRVQVTGDWRKSYNEGHHNLYPSHIRMMKSKRMR
jgi:hypothetical protein